MPTLVDSNILLRSLHAAHPHCVIAERALSVLRLREEVLCLATQNLVEFWAVATRQAGDNGLGMTHARAESELIALRKLFRILPSNIQVLGAWQRLVIQQKIIGKQTHDAHLAAVMEVYGVDKILTFNDGHFRRFPGITVVNPINFG